MEKHAEKLLSICRTCGNKIKIYDKYPQPKYVSIYADTIKELFKVDISDDKIEVHPQKLCENCKKQFDRYQKSLDKLIAKGEMFQFSAHKDVECFTCTVSRKKNERFSLIKAGVETKIAKWLSEYFVKTKCKDYNFYDTSSVIGAENEYCFSKIIQLEDVPTIKFSLAVTETGLWKFYAFQRLVKDYFKTYETYLNPVSLEKLLQEINELEVCKANDDFLELIQKRNLGSIDEFKDKNGVKIASVEAKYFRDQDSMTVIRHVNCTIVVSKDKIRCIPCSEYRKTLNTLSWRVRNASDKETHKNTPNMYLSKDQLKEKANRLSSDIASLKQSAARHNKFIADLVSSEGTAVSEELHDICADVLNQKSPFPEDSPLTLLWDEQKKQSSLTNKKSMKWHPTMIRWCISIYLKSPGAYEHLRNTGFLCLPHKTTLLNYANFTVPKSGINIDVLKQLHQETKNLSGFRRIVGIIFDEMKLKSGLIFNRHSGKIVGFSELGEINNELLAFKARVENKDETPPIATHMLTFMAKGLFSSIAYPFAYYPGQGATSDQLFCCFWECVRALEAINLHVHFATSDGAAPNRRFYKLHQLEEDENKSSDGVIFWCWNRYYHDEQRKIFFVCDVPHLLKTVRNNFENSHFHNNTRNLMINKQQISWQHIISVLNFDSHPSKLAPGLRQTKLTSDHVYLNPSLRMNVSLAAQVLSNSVALCLEKQNDERTVETRRFVRYFDKLFDCLNVKSKHEGHRRRKPDLLPYESVNDHRLCWMKEDFLHYINSWENHVESLENMSKDEKNRLCLSKQTLEGLRITVHSFNHLVAVMLESGASYILSDKLNQDSIEEHFGRQRMKGGGNENPNVLEYQYNELKLQVAKRENIRVLRGNTRGRKEKVTVDVNETTPLPKRKKGNEKDKSK